MLYERERRTAERLQELDDLREGFFALVAHEVRSPLGAIGTAAVGAARPRRHDGRRRSARISRRASPTGARRLARLTGDLVDASRGGHGTFPCEMAPIDDFGRPSDRGGRRGRRRRSASAYSRRRLLASRSAATPTGWRR